MDRWQAVLKLSHKNLFRVGFVWRVAIALVLAVSLSLISAPPAAAISLGDYFDITYDPVQFSTNIIHGDETLTATVRATATCKQDLPLSVSEAIITSRVVAEHQVNGTRVILNPSYTINIKPFPDKKEDEPKEINQDILLQFPASSESGNYEVIGELIKAEVKVFFFFEWQWWDVTEYLPQSQAMGSVEYFAPGDEPPTQYTLTINISGQGSTNPSQGSHVYDEGTEVPITAYPASGWEFDHWGGDASGTSTSVTITMDSDKSVTAYFSKIQYTLSTSVSPAGSGSVSPSGDSFDAGTVVALTANPAPGWEFDHWEGDASGTNTSVDITMTSNKTVTAYFQEIPQHILTIEVNGQGTTNPSPGIHTYNEGTVVTLTANPASGWEFDHWSGTNNNVINPTTVTMNTDKTVTAFFSEIPQHILTIEVNGQGTTNPSQGTHTYNEGTEVPITAYPNSGWAFDHWEGDASGTNASVTITMNTDKTVTAFFSEIPQHILTIEVNGQGTTNPSQGTHTYNEGTVVTITANPASGWQFDHWSGTNNNAINPTTVTMNTDKTVTAYFQQISPTQYTLTINISGQGTTNPSPGSHTYNEGTVVTITANPASGWQFDHWSGTNNNYINPTTVTMNSNKSVTAYFHEAVADILAYYRAYSGEPSVVDTQELLQAANDWANEVAPPGFNKPITTVQLLTLANEWATNTPQIMPVSLTIIGEDTTVHIANIDMGLTSTWWGWRTYATATVSIADAQGNPVPSATRIRSLGGATLDTDSGETGSQGRVKLSSNAVWKTANGTRFTFTVDEVTKSGWTYNPEANIATTDSIVKESGGFFSRIWLLLNSFIQRLGSMFSEVIKL